MRTRLRSLYRAMITGCLALGQAAALGGCASTTTTDAGGSASSPDNAVAPPDPSTSIRGQSPSDLAAQARRDVDTLLARSHQQTTPPAAAGHATARPAETTRTRSTPAIQWNSPPGTPALTAPPPKAVTETTASVSRTPAGRDIGGKPGSDPVAQGVMGSPEETLDAPASLPAGRLSQDRVAQLMVELSRELYRESAYADMPLRELMVIAAQSIARPNRALNPEAVPGLTDREREMLRVFQQFCRQIGEALKAGDDADAVFREQATLLRNALIEPPRVTIATNALCYRVKGFGHFDRFNRNAFLAHTSQKIIVYLEIEDFTSELNEKGKWVTELSQQLIIFSDRDGLPVWTADWQPVKDLSQNQRHDFFTVQVITLPTALGVGKYFLKIRVRDERSGAETDTGIEFQMVADPKLAATVP